LESEVSAIMEELNALVKRHDGGWKNLSEAGRDGCLKIQSRLKQTSEATFGPFGTSSVNAL
jgi:hypothetical protein